MSIVLNYYIRYCKEIRRKLPCLRWINTDKPAPWPLAIYPGDMVAGLAKNVLDLRHACLSCYVLR